MAVTGLEAVRRQALRDLRGISASSSIMRFVSPGVPAIDRAFLTARRRVAARRLTIIGQQGPRTSIDRSVDGVEGVLQILHTALKASAVGSMPTAAQASSSRCRRSCAEA